MFGDFFAETKCMPVAVDGFFANGGKRCYVARIVDRDAAVAASADLGSVLITAVGEGAWGNGVAFRVKPASTERTGFKLQVHYWTAAKLPNPVDPAPSPEELEATRAQLRQQAAPQQTEEFDDLVLDPASPNYVEKRVGKNLGLSTLVELTHVIGNNDRPRTAADVPRGWRRWRGRRSRRLPGAAGSRPAHRTAAKRARRARRAAIRRRRAHVRAKRLRRARARRRADHALRDRQARLPHPRLAAKPGPDRDD